MTKSNIIIGDIFCIFDFQFSLMLEFCPKGNLRSYLIDHDKEFKRSLKYYHDKGYITEEKQLKDTVIHDIKMLCFWACQVGYENLWKNVHL